MAGRGGDSDPDDTNAVFGPIFGLEEQPQVLIIGLSS